MVDGIPCHQQATIIKNELWAVDVIQKDGTMQLVIECPEVGGCQVFN